MKLPGLSQIRGDENQTKNTAGVNVAVGLSGGRLEDITITRLYKQECYRRFASGPHGEGGSQNRDIIKVSMGQHAEPGGFGAWGMDVMKQADERDRPSSGAAECTLQLGQLGSCRQRGETG